MALATKTEKIMFEIYREAAHGRFRAVYFTELDEHNKEKEIDDAMRGDHLFDGYLRSPNRDEAKRAVARILDRLNSGEAVGRSQIESELKPFLA